MREKKKNNLRTMISSFLQKPEPWWKYDMKTDIITISAKSGASIRMYNFNTKFQFDTLKDGETAKLRILKSLSNHELLSVRRGNTKYYIEHDNMHDSFEVYKILPVHLGEKLLMSIQNKYANQAYDIYTDFILSVYGGKMPCTIEQFLERIEW
jgi:hypothetical protein